MVKYYKQIIGLITFLFTIGYVVLGDITQVIFGENNSAWYKYAFLAIIIIIYMVFLLLTSQLDIFFARKFGFSNVHKHWSPGTSVEISGHNKKILMYLISKSKEIRIVSVTGDWDLIRPFSETEFNEIFAKNNISLKIILCHPNSTFLKEHAKNEENQETERLKSKILTNSKKLLALNADIRWSLHQPAFHFLSGDDEIHFGYYPKKERLHF